MKSWILVILTLVGPLALFSGLALAVLEVDLSLEASGSLAGLDANEMARLELVFIGAIIQWVGASKL
jgi:hypothetical protein